VLTLLADLAEAADRRVKAIWIDFEAKYLKSIQGGLCCSSLSRFHSVHVSLGLAVLRQAYPLLYSLGARAAQFSEIRLADTHHIAVSELEAAHLSEALVKELGHCTTDAQVKA
jgi:hypothetical protein